MAYNTQDIQAQTWVFPAAAAATALTNSIWIPAGYEVIGFVPSAALEAGTDELKPQIVPGGVSISTADADAGTFVGLNNSSGAVVYTASAAAVLPYIFSDGEVLRGPMRIRLQAYDNGVGAINQDGQIVYPLIRRISNR
jgi:hypothetical protein